MRLGIPISFSLLLVACPTPTPPPPPDTAKGLSGRLVVLADGKTTPVAGRVTLIGGVFGAVAGADGKFTIDLPAGTFTLVATADTNADGVPDRARTLPDLAGATPRDVGDVMLEGLASVKGAVTAGGVAVPGALVAVAGSVLARAGADGRFAISGLVPGNAQLAAAHTDEAGHTFVVTKQATLAAGAETVVDLALGDASAAKTQVRGTIRALSGAGELTALIQPPAGEPQRIVAGAEGLWTTELPAGLYRVQGRRRDSTEPATVIVAAGGEVTAPTLFLGPRDATCGLAGTPDTDGDGIGDVCDACPGVKETSQLDPDGDGFGASCGVDRSAPQIASSTPADGAVNVEPDVVIRITFDEPLSDTSVEAGLRVSTPQGTAVTGAATRDGNTLVFTPAAPLSGGVRYAVRGPEFLADLRGNVVLAAPAIGFTTKASTDPSGPKVITSEPGRDEKGVQPTTTVFVGFDRDVDPASLDTTNVTLLEGTVPIDCSLAKEARGATLTPLADLAETTDYTVRVSGVKDLLGNVMAPDSWTFTTQDLTPPSIVSKTEGSRVPVDAAVTVVFDEPVGNPAFRLFNDDTNDELPGTVEMDTFEVRFVPDTPMPEDTPMRASLEVTDLVGNAGSFGWTFKTRGPPDLTAPVLLSSVPIPYADEVSPSADIVLHFDDEIDPASVTASSFEVLINDEAQPGTYTTNGTTVRFTPNPPLAFSARVEVYLHNQITNLDGTAYTANDQFYFHIGCPPCSAPQTCGGGGDPNTCGCTPKVTCEAGQNCGTIPDGCGGTLTCSPDTCMAGQCGVATPNVCACTPLTACPAGLDCGTFSDSCGGTLTCGTSAGGCPSGKACGTGPSANKCVCTATCASLGFECGYQPDGCFGTLDCGICSSPKICDRFTGKCGGCQAETDLELCAKVDAECTSTTVTDRCGASRNVTCTPFLVQAKLETCGGGGVSGRGGHAVSTFTWENPKPQGNSLRAIWGSSPTDVWMAGDHGTLIHSVNGTMTVTDLRTAGNLFGLWGVDANNIWAVGEAGRIFKYDGANWTRLVSGTSMDLHAIWGLDANNIWAVGDNDTVTYWNGATWTPTVIGDLKGISPPPPNLLRGVWGSDANNVWAVGCQELFHWNGTNWKRSRQPFADGLVVGCWSGITGRSATDVTVVQDGPTIAHFDGSTWTTRDVSAVSQGVNSVVAFGANDLWYGGTANGFYGTTTHQTGPSTYVNVTVPAGNSINAIWGTGPTDVWAVGKYGLILHSTGGAWTNLTTGALNEKLIGVWAASPTEAWATTARGQVFKSNAGAWPLFVQLKDGTFDASAYGIWGAGPGDVWVPSYQSAMHYAGGTWTKVAVRAGQSTNGLTGSGPTSQAVFTDNAVLLGDGATFTLMAAQPIRTQPGRSMYMFSTSHILYEDSSKLQLFNGTAWSTIETFGSFDNPPQVMGVGRDYWVVNSQEWHRGIWGGTSYAITLWTPPLYGVASWGTNVSNAWWGVGAARGQPPLWETRYTGTQYNGTAWSPMELGTWNVLTGITGTANDLWVVGEGGMILHQSR